MRIVKHYVGLLLVVVAALTLSTACGHSEDEWQGAQRDIAKLKADLDAANKRHTDDDQKYAAAQQQIDDLNAKLKELGVGLSRSEDERSKLRLAMSEYEARLKQLDDMKARFRDLKGRLDKLTRLFETSRHDVSRIKLDIGPPKPHDLTSSAATSHSPARGSADKNKLEEA